MAKDQKEKFTELDISVGVTTILHEHLSIASFPMSAKLAEDLGADSLDRVELVMLLEEKFSIDVEFDDFDDIKTVNDVIIFVSEKLE